MLSSRSRTLVYARCRGGTVSGIEQASLAQVAGWSSCSRRAALQQNILAALRKLKALAASVGEDAPSQLPFGSDGTVSLLPRTDVSLLPSREVLAALALR